ncbi:MAG: hypothetical protein PVH89_09215 [Gammaproteobacteria bacterium]|jgi:hypothetical protein
MKLKLSDWANFAEILSGLAVIVTLVVLIVGIRENSAVTRVSAYGDLMQSVVDIESLVIQDPNLDRILTTFYEETTGGLSEDERRTVTTYAGVLLRNYERAYFSQEYGVISDEQWDRFERLICANGRRAQLAGLDVENLEFLTESFRDHIKTSCGEVLE